MTLSKSEYRTAKDVLKVGILRKHEQWQQELRELLDRPFDDEIGNAFDRSWMITKKSRDWFKELNRMEEWYKKDFIALYVRAMYQDGTLTDDDIAPLSDETKNIIKNGRW